MSCSGVPYVHDNQALVAPLAWLVQLTPVRDDHSIFHECGETQPYKHEQIFRHY